MLRTSSFCFNIISLKLFEYNPSSLIAEIVDHIAINSFYMISWQYMGP